MPQATVRKVLMKGNEALAEAAIQAGCRYFFGYPISPQSEIPAYMSWRMPEVGGVFLQAESELAAINMVYGAVAAGGRAMTSSSSPGIALKQEGISTLSANRLPAVIVSVMRGGPGLGNIAGAQGDYFQATRGGGNGDYQIIVLAPASVQEMAELTITAFELAEKYRMVAMILADGYLAQMSEAMVLPDRTLAPPERDFALDEDEERPRRAIATLRLGTTNSLADQVWRAQDVYRQVEKEEKRHQEYLTHDADIILCAYGTSARICREAIDELRKDKVRVGLFRPISLWPFPYEALQRCSKKAKCVLVVEMSSGQMQQDVLLAVNGRLPVALYGEVGGVIPRVAKIKERVKSYVSDHA